MSNNCLKSRQELEQALQEINQSMEFPDSHLELLSDSRTMDFIEFLRVHFFPDENLSKSIGLKFDAEMKRYLSVFYKQNLSVLLVDNKSNEIIASTGIGIFRKDQPVDSSQTTNKEWAQILAFLEHKSNEMDAYKYFNVDFTVGLSSLCTHRKYRHKGLATKTLQSAVLFAKKLGLSPVCIHIECTAIGSQKASEKLGFEKIQELRHDDYKIDGEIVFKNTDVKTTKCYAKQL